MDIFLISAGKHFVDTTEKHLAKLLYKSTLTNQMHHDLFITLLLGSIA